MTEMSLEQKRKVLASLVTATQKKHGGSVHALSFAKDRVDDLRFEFIPTPSEYVNAALSGGFVRGKIIEASGENSSGKTSLLLETIALDHKNDPEAVWGWFETEHSFDPEYAFGIKGIDPDRLLYWDVSDTGAESGLDTLEMLIRSNTLKGIVVNSVTGLTPKKELETLMEKQEVALQARMMSKLMRKITAIAGKTKTAVIFTNQTRVNVGQMFGDPNTATGGKALGFFATQRIHLTKVKIDAAKDGLTEEQGIKVNVKIRKNRCAKDNPYKATSYTAIYGEGIDFVKELAQLAIDQGIVQTGGAWIYYPSKDNIQEIDGIEMKFGSKAKFMDAIRGSEPLQDFLRNAIKNGKVEMGALESSEIEQIEREEKEAEASFGDEANLLPDLDVPEEL